MIIRIGRWERKMKEKIEWIDITKGLLIALVVLGHITLTKEIDRGGIIKPSYMIENLWSGIMCWIYACHIPGFFMVNGILKNRTNYLARQYSLKSVIYKQKRIFKYYLLFSTIFFIRYVVQALVGHDDWSDVYWFAVNTCSFVGMGVLWFLPAFIIAQLIFHLYITGGRIQKMIIFLLLTLSLVLSYHDVNNIVECNNIPIKILGVLTRSFIGFSFLVTGYYLDRTNVFENKYLFLGVFSSFAFTNSLVDMNKLIFNNALLFYLFAILGLMLVVALSKLIARYFTYVKKIMQFWGRESLFIMCTHTVLLIIHASIFLSIQISKVFWIDIVLAFVFTMIVETYLAANYRIVLSKFVSK